MAEKDGPENRGWGEAISKESHNDSEDVAHSNPGFSKRENQEICTGGNSTTISSEDVSNSSNNGCKFLQYKGGIIDQGGEKQASDVESYSSRTRWAVEPAICRVANGVPNRVDRLKGLGNAIVPQVAYEIMRCLK